MGPLTVTSEDPRSAYEAQNGLKEFRAKVPCMLGPGGMINNMKEQLHVLLFLLKNVHNAKQF